MRNSRLQALAFLFATMILTSCGGGGGGTFTPPPPAPLTITSTLAAPFNGEDYSAPLTATGGTAPYSWSISNGSLPAGLTLNGSAITGQPTQDGASTFTLQVKDSAARVASQDISITVSTRFHFVTRSLPNGVAKQPYSATVTTAGATGSVVMTVSGNPYGTQMNNGVLEGSTVYAGTYNITVRATDSASPPSVISKTFSMDFLGLSYGFMYNGRLGDAYHYDLTALGGTDPIRWSLLDGNLPPGLSFQNAIPGSGLRVNGISGVPTEVGTYPFTVRLVDSSNPPRTYDGVFSLRVDPPFLGISTTQLKRGEIGIPYSATLQGTGGLPPYVWSTTFGTQLPAGLTLSASGQITGTPTTEQRTDVSFQLRDSLNSTFTKTFTMLVTKPLPPRNDSIANATPLPFGIFTASISPYGDPAGTSNPDVDYYKIVSTGGKIVHVTAGASWINFHSSGMQPGIEIIDSNGFRYATCNDPANDNEPAGSPIPSDPTPNGFDDQCMNLAYLNPNTKTADLYFQVPGAGTVTFYVRVFDYRGDARPDFLYELAIGEQP